MEANDTYSVKLRLGVGRYKLLTPTVAQPLFIDIEENAQCTATTIVISRVNGSLTLSAARAEDVYENLEGASTEGGKPKRVVLAPGPVVLQVENEDGDRHRLQVAWRSLASIVRLSACCLPCLSVLKMLSVMCR